MVRAAFMGRAGTIHNLPANGILNIGRFEIFSGVPSALNILGQQGYFLAIVGTERETVPGMDYQRIVLTVERYIADMVAFPIAFKFCMHHFSTSCDCRLPKPGLIEQFRSELDVDLEKSIMIASREAEVEGAISAGIGTIVRVSTGKGKWSEVSEELPLYDSLLMAVEELSGVKV